MTAALQDERELAGCKNLRVSYGSGDAAVVALADVDLTIRWGDAIALWGPSGSGKTTLLHALGGLITPSAGTVTWRGRPLSSLDAAARRRVRTSGIAYVFQRANLLPNFTAFENVAFAMHVSATTRGDLEADDLLALVGLEGKAESLPSELSGGEGQRVAIARALGQRPELLLCDEPTGQLDSDTGQRVLDLIGALRQEFGFAVVIATHDADVAARYDRAVEISDGHVTAMETFQS